MSQNFNYFTKLKKNNMKKTILLCLVFTFVTSSIFSQTSKWGISYSMEFTNSKISIGGQSFEESFNVNNLNVHYSILSWSSAFQVGPLVSLRFGKIDGQSFDDFQVGLNLGYNFSDKFAIVMDTYKVLNSDLDDHHIYVFKPAAEYNFSGNISAALGYVKYAYGGNWREINGVDVKTGGLLLGLKYKF